MKDNPLSIISLNQELVIRQPIDFYSMIRSKRWLLSSAVFSLLMSMIALIFIPSASATEYADVKILDESNMAARCMDVNTNVCIDKKISWISDTDTKTLEEYGSSIALWFNVHRIIIADSYENIGVRLVDNTNRDNGIKYIANNGDKEIVLDNTVIIVKNKGKFEVSYASLLKKRYKTKSNSEIVKRRAIGLLAKSLSSSDKDPLSSLKAKGEGIADKYDKIDLTDVNDSIYRKRSTNKPLTNEQKFSIGMVLFTIFTIIVFTVKLLMYRRYVETMSSFLLGIVVVTIMISMI